jgi:8-oxo-dGTP pyrophosphatase MutT (NUDIX family)
MEMLVTMIRHVSTGRQSRVNLWERIASDIHLMVRRPARLQFAALCYRWKKKKPELEILLITSRDTGRWVIPKGWPMAGKKAHTVAEREAFEEAGVSGKARREPLGFYTYMKGLNSGLKVNCKVQVHAVEVDDMLKSYPEKGSRTLEWVSCSEAATRVQEPELKKLLLDFEQDMTERTAPKKRALQA